jgi:hypothetical protein
MTGLQAITVKDATGLDAVRADLASIMQQVPGPARVSLRTSHCDRDRLNRDRHWHERSQADRGSDPQVAQAPDVFAAGMRYSDTPDRPRSPDPPR